MSEPFLSEIKIVPFPQAPVGWALCNGQFLPINQNQALFALLGTTYGGNGQTTFALPNLRGRVPIHFGGSHDLGEAAGSTSVTINIQQLPTHTHQLSARNDIVDADLGPQDPTGKLFAQAQVSLQAGGTAKAQLYAQPSNLVALNPQAVSNVGGSQPHNNMMPYLTLNFIIALQGIFPSRN
jgi:microcystin-dependent protein